jgi:hypothetical protein
MLGAVMLNVILLSAFRLRLICPNEEESCIASMPVANVIKLFMSVIYEFSK